MRFLFLILLTIIITSLYSQETTLLGRTLPEDVYYDLDGSWRFDLSSAIKGDPSDLLRNFVFEMTPDLRAEIWLFNKFFFETEITEISENNLFLFGYQNSEPGLQEVRLGNSELNIDEYAGYIPPESEEFTPGSRAKYSTDKGTQEILLRYTKEVQESVKFIGKNQVTEEKIKATDYLRGKFFVLNSFNGNEELYTYETSLKKLDRSSYVYYEDLKLLYISQDIDNLYISAVSSSILGDSTLDTLVIDGATLIEIFNRGEFSPIEFLGGYRLESEPGGDHSFSIENIESDNYEVIDDIFIILDNNNFKYPLIDYDPSIYTKGSGLDVPFYIYFRTITPAETIVLDDKTMGNSFYVTINGQIYSDWSFDNETKILTINREISPFDVIEIKYKNSSEIGIGNLLGVYGGRFNITDNLSFEVSTAGNWNFLGEDYTTEIDESTGNLDISGELIYSSDKFHGGVQGEVEIFNPDTSKGYELFNYDVEEYSITLGETELKSGDDSTIPLITREDSFTVNSSSIETLPLKVSGSPYLVSYKSGDSTNKVIVFETDDLPFGEKSIGRVKLDELAGDYSNNKKVEIEIAGSHVREVEARFNTGDGGFTRSLDVDSNYIFNTKTIYFTKNERESLKFLKSIDLIFSSGESSITIVKDIVFEGDRVWTYDSDGDIYLSKDSKELRIRNIDSSKIKLRTPVNESLLSNYNSLEFYLENDGVIKSSTVLEISVLSSTGKSRKYVIGPGIEDKKSFKLDISSGKSIPNSYKKDEVIIEITNSSPGSLKVSPIILKDPKLQFDRAYSGYFNLKSELNYSINDYTIISLNEIYGDGYYNEELGKVNGGLKGELLLGEYTLESGYDNEDTTLFYSYLFPVTGFPIRVFDSFGFNESSHRENYLEIDTTAFKGKYSLSSHMNSETLIRNNTLTSSLNTIIIGELEGEVIQEEESLGEPKMDDIGKSYNTIILNNELDKKNSFSGELTFGSKVGLYNPSITLGSDFNQKFDSIYSIENKYLGGINNKLNFNILSIDPFLLTTYKKSSENIEKSSLGRGFNENMDLFIEDNPYNSIDLNTLLFNDDYIVGYNLKNQTGIAIEVSEIDSRINFLIPSGFNFSIVKEGEEKGDLDISSRSFVNSIDFKFNNTIKNSGTVTYTQGLLNKEDSLGIDINSFILWEINSEDTLDITNSYKYTDLGFTNLTEIDYIWVGKSGPVYIAPIFDFYMDSPYKFTHTERGYFLFEDERYKIGVRHETMLEVKDTNKTEAYIDVIYEDDDNVPFSFSLGINTTLIF